MGPVVQVLDKSETNFVQTKAAADETDQWLNSSEGDVTAAADGGHYHGYQTDKLQASCDLIHFCLHWVTLV